MTDTPLPSHTGNAKELNAAAAAQIEHANVCVADPDASAARLERLFGWRVRWAGYGHTGRSVHVGSENNYIALYDPGRPLGATAERYATSGLVNHIGVTVADLDACETRVRAEGLTPFSHADYAPGRRFYFIDPDGIEFEVVSYA